MIVCPAGHYCSIGAYKPTQCSIGASCPKGTEKDQSVLPFGLLLLFDSILVLWIVWRKVAARFKRKYPRKAKGSRFSLRRAATFLNDSRQNKQYQSLDDDNDITLEANILKVQRTPTGFHEAVEEDFVYNPEFAHDSQSSSDLHLFVQSLSKCIGASKFGLSFGFEGLSFQPAKAEKPILSEVTGHIGHGSLWGVMGASGAGKCKRVTLFFMSEHKLT